MQSYLLRYREEIVVIAGTLQNVDLARFRDGQIRNVISDAVHPKWEKDPRKKFITRYHDVGLLFLNQVRVDIVQTLNIC